MASFALWGTACETTFWPPGTFLRAYDANRRAAIDGVIETDPVATFVRQNNGQTDEVGRHGIGFAGGLWRDNLDENGGGNQSVKRRPVAKS